MCNGEGFEPELSVHPELGYTVVNCDFRSRTTAMTTVAEEITSCDVATYSSMTVGTVVMGEEEYCLCNGGQQAPLEVMTGGDGSRQWMCRGGSYATVMSSAPPPEPTDDEPGSGGSEESAQPEELEQPNEPAYATGMCRLDISEVLTETFNGISANVSASDADWNELGYPFENTKFGKSVTVSADVSSLPSDIIVGFPVAFEPWKGTGDLERRQNTEAYANLYQRYVVEIQFGGTYWSSKDHHDTIDEGKPYCNVGGWNNDYDWTDLINARDGETGRKLDCYFAC